MFAVTDSGPLLQKRIQVRSTVDVVFGTALLALNPHVSASPKDWNRLPQGGAGIRTAASAQDTVAMES